MLPGLQILRGVAAMLVVLDHVEGSLGLPQYLGHDFAGGLLLGGAIGVDLFFVISGFIIFYITDGLRADPGGLVRFAAHRFARIVPFMWLCVGSYLLLRWSLNDSVDVMAYLRAFVLFPVGEVLPGEVWTLRHEMFFYLVAGLALAGQRWVWVPAVFVLLAIPVGVVMAEGPRSGIEEWVFAVFRPRANLAFGLGMALAWCHRRQSASAGGARSARWVVVTSPFILLMAGNLLPASGSPEWERSFLLLPLIGAAVWAALALGPSAGSISRWLQGLGDASYSIYLTHAALVALVAKLMARIDPPGAGWLGLVLAAALSAWVGVWVHHHVERPLVQRTRRWLSPDVHDAARHPG